MCLCFEYQNDYNINNLLKFTPVNESTYEVRQSRTNRRGSLKGFGSQFKEVNFIFTNYKVQRYPWIEQKFYEYRKSLPKSKKKTERIELIYLKSKLNKSHIAMLFSQGEQTTLGSIYPFLLDLCSMLKIDIISYDYSGFGKSQGIASKENALNDIQEVISFINDILLIQPNDLILFGHSMGAIPTFYLSTRENYSHLAGVVLLSPPREAFNVNINNSDININEDSGTLSIECPFYLIHGQRDEIVNYRRIEQMKNIFKNSFEWFPKLGDHYNIITLYRLKFYKKLKSFITYVERERMNRKIVINDVMIEQCDKSELELEVIDGYIEKKKEYKAISLDDGGRKSSVKKRNSTEVERNIPSFHSSTFVIEFEHSKSSIETTRSTKLKKENVDNEEGEIELSDKEKKSLNVVN